MKLNFQSHSLSLPLLAAALLGPLLPLEAATVVIDNFESGEGHFASAPNASGSRRRILDSSTADQTMTEFFQGSASEQLVINRNTDPSAPAPTAPSGPAEWYLRFLSGGGTIANNDAIPNTGNTWVGFWVMTTASNLEVGIMLDDDYNGTSNNHEMSNFISVVGDGLWHLYQFQLSDANTWNNFAGSLATIGEINSATVTIDSLSFRGTTGGPDSTTVFVDNVSYNTDGPIPVPEPSVLALAGVAAAGLMRRRK